MENQIEKILKEYSPGDELEIRVGYFRGDRFHSALTSFMFQYLLKQFSEMNYEVSRQMQTVYMHPADDPQEKLKTIVAEDEVVTILKKTTAVEDLPQLGLRLALSIEKIQGATPEISGVRRKERNRTTFRRENINYRIDLTLDQQGRRSHYQLEVEYTGRPSLPELNGMISWLAGLRENLYYNQKIIGRYNSYFVGDPKFRYADKETPYTGGAMPKNLKPFLVPFLGEYAVHSKPNGVSYFLFFSEYGIFYINRTEIYPSAEQVAPEGLKGTIIIGEFINNKFYAFDTLVYRHQDVRPMEATRRNKLLYHIQEQLKWRNFEVLPMFYTGDLHKDFESVFRYIRSEWTPETNDGVVLKPQYLPFNNPYVYKWKPLRHVTIDLAVKKIGKVYFGYAYDKSGLVPFKGSEKYPYSGEVNISDFDVPEYSILEFGYDPARPLLPSLKAVRLRTDKIKPNYIGVAVSTWQDIRDPFTEERLIALSKNVIAPQDTLAGIVKKVCTYLKLTKDPCIFKELNEYIESDLITQIFKGAAILGTKKGIGNDLVPVLSGYFAELSL